MAEDLKDAIADSAQGPAEARGDSGSMRQHSLRDMIEADRYLAAKDALATTGNKPTLGIRMVLLSPPGAI